MRPGDPRAALAHAELLVLPTLEDGSPFAAAEAMASGLPVVTTTATGAAEWIRHDVTGWVVPPRSSDALAAVLAGALEQRHRLPEMGRQARLDTEARVGDCDRAFTEWMAQLSANRRLECVPWRAPCCVRQASGSWRPAGPTQAV